MFTRAMTLWFIRSGGVCLLLLCHVLSGALSAQESVLKRAEDLLKKLETAESNRDPGLLPEVLTEQLAKAEEGLAAHLQTHPQDVKALIISVKLAWFSQVMKSAAFPPGQEPPDHKAIDASLHEKLDRVLSLEPGNAEAHYWKARLYGLRHPVIRQGIVAYVYSLDKAIKFSRKAVDLDPANKAYREALALYLFENQKLAEAIAVIKPVDDMRHPIYLLLSDLELLPVPKAVILLQNEATNSLVNNMMQGRLLDYRQVRVRSYVMSMSVVKIEEFYSSHWSGFKFFPKHGTEKTPGGEFRIFAQHLIRKGNNLQHATVASSIPEEPDTGIILALVEMRNLLPEIRSQILSGVDSSAIIGDTFCFLLIVNCR
jgi:hypothetical protein